MLSELPKPYRKGYREILSAEATVVDLHKLGPYYYTLGTKLSQFDHVESPDIAESLLKVRLHLHMLESVYNNAATMLE